MAGSVFRVLSGISGNLAAGWFALVFISPGYIEFEEAILTKSLIFASINFILAVIFDRLSTWTPNNS